MPPEPAGWEACATPWRGHPCPRVRELPSSVSPTGPFKHAPGPGGGSGEAESSSVSLHFARLDWPAQPPPSTLCSGIHLRTLSRINPTDARSLASAEVQASLRPASLRQRGRQNETQEARPLANPGHHPQLPPRSKPMTCTSSFSGAVMSYIVLKSFELPLWFGAFHREGLALTGPSKRWGNRIRPDGKATIASVPAP